MNSIALFATIGVLVVVAVLAAHLYFFLKHTRPADQRVEPSTGAEPQRTSGPDAVEESAAAVRRGVRAFMRADYASAFRLLEPAGRAGDLRAQQLLAKMYYAGNGVARDREQYLYWLKRAAENGDKPSKAKVKKIEAAKAAKVAKTEK